MNEFQASNKDDCLAISSGGTLFDLNLAGIDELNLHFKDGEWRITTGSKTGYIVEGYQCGDTIHTGMMTGEEVHTSGSRLFKGRMSGRLHDIDRKMLDKALNEYEKALARDRRGGHTVLPKWAEIFNVKPTTVQGWLCAHRAVRKQETNHIMLEFVDMLK